MKIKRSKDRVILFAKVIVGTIFIIFLAHRMNFENTRCFIYNYGVIGGMLVAAAATLFTYVSDSLQMHHQYRNYPGPPRTSLIMGNYDEMSRAQSQNKLFDLLGSWIVKYGDTIVIWRQSTAKFFTADPDVIKSMLTEILIFKKMSAIPNRALFGQRITGTSSFLTVTEGTAWAMKRKIMSPYFTKIRLADIFTRCNDFIKRGIDEQLTEDVVAGETVVDLVDFYGQLYQFLLGALGFDLDCQLVSANAKFHNQVIQELLKWIPQQFQGFTQLMKMRFNPEVNDTICHLTRLRNLCKEILDYKTKEFNEKGCDPTDIIHHVIEASRAKIGKNKKPGTLSAEQDAEKSRILAMDDLLTIFLVIDNMAKTMATVFVRLIRDQRIYRKVVEEVRAADTTDLLSMDKSLRYTEMVILEALRLHPTLMRGIRLTHKEVTLSNGMRMPKKTMIFFGQLVLHRHPKYWADPLEFKPERWENGSRDITPFTYLPFVAGPRVCMGKHLAMMTMKMGMIHTLKRHDISPEPGTEKEMDWDYRFTIVKPTKGQRVIFSKIPEISEDMSEEPEIEGGEKVEVQ